MSYAFYKVLHLSSVIILFASLAGMLFARHAHAEREGKPPLWVPLVALHGVSLLVLFVSGFGLIARLGIGHGAGGWPTWIWMKIGLWLVIGAFMVLVKRLWKQLLPLFLTLLALGIVTVWTAVTKPGPAPARAAPAAEAPAAVDVPAEDAGSDAAVEGTEP
ncbi:MAG: hypothetical protein EA398_05400 [Deltaproteobacteria bacterium]|nr:MAG: hypothetical protein EA398_05400 [Deltaproteobacteria bacterium]